MRKCFYAIIVVASLLSSCHSLSLGDHVEKSRLVMKHFSKQDLIIAAGALYDTETDSFRSGTITVKIVDNELNKVKDLICRYSARYTTNNSSVYPYIQVYYNNPPLSMPCYRMKYKMGDEGDLRYGECKCITNGKTSGFSNYDWDGDYVVRIVVPDGVTLIVDSFVVEYDNSFINKEAFRVMQHGSIFGAPMDCEANWQGWSHVGNYGAIVVPKRTIDGVWVCYHDDTFGDNPKVRVIGNPSAVLPAVSVQACTYKQVQTLEYITENSFGFHDRIPKLETFLEYCVKTGVHPVFSIHPNWTVEQWLELKALVEKYNLLDKLNIKGGYNAQYIDKIYNVFGSEIESFVMDLALETQPTYEQVSTLAAKNWDMSTIKVGYEYMSNAGGYFSEENLELMRQKGLVHGLYIHATESNHLNAEFIRECIQKGCYELCADYFFSNGLNW